MTGGRTPEQDARFTDATASYVASEFSRQTAAAVICGISARIANNAPNEVTWDECTALQDQADLHKRCRDELHQALVAYIIDGDDPSDALNASRKA